MTAKIRILHVDDNLHDRQLVKDALQKEHDQFEIVEADNREKFEKYLTEGGFHLVLSDFNILGFNGLQVLQAVKEKDPDLPVIIVTGTGSEEIAIQAMKMGAADYVIKTVKHIQGLEPTIKSVLEHKKAQEECKIAQIALKENEELYRSIYENTSVAILVTAPDGNIISANDFACKLFNKTKEEILTTGEIKGLIDDADPRFNIWLEERKRTGKAQGELTFIKKDGPKFQAEVSSVVFLDKDGRERTSMVIRDLTEQKKSEEAIWQEQIRLRTLINNLPDAIYVKDNEGRKLIANSADLKIMNYASEAEIIGKTDKEIFGGEIGAHGYAEDLSVLKSGQPLINHEDCFTDTEGNQHWRLISKIPLFDEQKQIIGLVGFGRDITERKRSVEQLLKAKEKAEESDRLKTAFLQNISHEIRTPMNAIVGFSGFLSDSDLSKEKREYFTDIIIQSSNQLLSIITDIVNIATIEAGQEKVQEKEMNLNSMFKLLQKQFFLKAQKQNITLSIKTMLPDTDANIITDGTKLTEVLTNLIGNALKFTRQGSINLGYNIVGAQDLVPSQPQQLQFFVEDTGIGIPSELHEDIFKRFHQVELTANREFGGSGLGLSISKAYVELLGGKIWVDSEPCKGSIFYFTIPYKKGGQKTLQTKSPLNEIKIEVATSKTLLIAEDEDNNFMLLEELLSGLNFKIIRAINGVKAVEICKTNPEIDLVLMDIKMPIMNGFEATKLIKELKPNLPVIAQTAYSTEADKNKALSCGCSDFISKPFKKELLLSVIHQQLVHE